MSVRRLFVSSLALILLGYQPLCASAAPVKIVIDPGHGGHDLGAEGKNGVLEKDLVLQVSKQLVRDLERSAKSLGLPLEVHLTRTDDTFVALRARAQLANDLDADVFVSVHANSSTTPSLRGFEVYFLNVDSAQQDTVGSRTPSSQVAAILDDIRINLHINRSSQFAEAVYRQMERTMRANVRGVRQAPFTVLESTQMPSVLVEIGYVTSPRESKHLKDHAYKKTISRAIGRGVLDFISSRTSAG